MRKDLGRCADEGGAEQGGGKKKPMVPNRLNLSMGYNLLTVSLSAIQLSPKRVTTSKRAQGWKKAYFCRLLLVFYKSLQ